MTRYRGRNRATRPKARHKNHVIWSENHKGTWTMVYGPDDERIKTAPGKSPEWASEDGDVVYLTIPSHPNYLTVELTAFTSQELNYLKFLFDRAFEAALPLVQERDEHAESIAEDPGSEIILDRTYRAVPTLYVRQRFIGQHGEELFEGYTVLPD